jgi:tetratricopeptide (TPR) repeat protein
VTNWVKPKTKCALCSFVDLGEVETSEPEAFVSHTWSRPFREMVTCLQQHFDENVYVWIDIFAVNQHTVDEEGSDLEQLVDTVNDIPIAVVVVDPEGVIFSRAWCLFEMHLAAMANTGRDTEEGGRSAGGGTDHDGELGSYPVSASSFFDSQGLMQRDRMQRRRTSYYAEHYARALVGKLVLMPYLLVGSDEEKVSSMMYDVDVRKASSTHEVDAENIRAVIEASCGITEFNGKLKAAFAEGLAGLPDVINPSSSTNNSSYSWLQVAELAQLAGRVLERAGMYAKCLKLHETCLNIRRVELGERHPEVATAINNIGFAHYLGGEYGEAERVLLDAIAMRRELLGGEHPQLATSINNLALVYMAEGDKEEAEALLQQALVIREAAFGGSHEKVAATLNMLGRLMVERGEFDGGEALYRRTRDIFAASMGAGHPFTAASVFYLAEISMFQGNLSSAEAMFREAYGMWETALGPNHPYSAACLGKLAQVLMVEEKYKDAEGLLSRALMQLRNLLGPHHPELPAVMVKLAEVRIHLGNLERAEKLLRRSVNICNASFSPTHATRLETMRMFAVLALQRGEVGEARRQFEELLPLWTEVSQVCDFRCAALLCDMAMLEHASGDMKAARMYLNRALFLSKSASARDHPDVLKSLKAMGERLGRCTAPQTNSEKLAVISMRRRMEKTICRGKVSIQGRPGQSECRLAMMQARIKELGLALSCTSCHATPVDITTPIPVAAVDT